MGCLSQCSCNYGLKIPPKGTGFTKGFEYRGLNLHVIVILNLKIQHAKPQTRNPAPKTLKPKAL